MMIFIVYIYIIIYLIEFDLIDHNNGKYTFQYNTFSTIYYPLRIYIKAMSKKYKDDIDNMSQIQNIKNSPFLIEIPQNMNIQSNESITTIFILISWNKRNTVSLYY